MGNIIMSLKEKEQVVVFEQLKKSEISQVTAGQMLGFSERWVRKKLKRYLAIGILGLIHKNRGRPSQRAWKQEEKDRAIELFRGEFVGFEPTYGAEKLAELYGIKISKETLRKALIKAGLWTPGKKRVIYRKRRERKACLGLMIQLDGSPHDWFEGRAPKCTLLVFIDDATSKLVWLEFAQSESFDGVMNATLKYFKKHGRPVSFYVDYGSVFSVNTNNPEREKLTQFERAMEELGVEVIHARSPQAKGRVERVNQTLQKRLVKEMRLAKISSIEAANKYVQGVYINEHNKRFAQAAAQPGNAHRPIKGFDLHNIFCAKEKRVLQNDFTISYKNRQLQLLKQQKAVIGPRQVIDVHEHLDGSVSLWIRGIRLDFDALKQCSSKIKNAVDYIQKHKEDELLNQETETTESIGSISLHEFLMSRKKGDMGSRVKRPWPAVEANPYV
jgi:DNA-binding Lrp family transcriptional regulator